MFKRIIEVKVTPTPAELAYEWSNMSEHDQAAFFNELARIVYGWSIPFCVQLQEVTDCPTLSDEARHIMEQIGEYAYPLKEESC